MQKRILISYLLIVLLVEKTVQHTFVSLSFLYDIGSVRSTVAVDYRALMISGAVIAILFAVALPVLIQRKRWSLYLVTLLAASDTIGEFIAQGTVFVAINVSLVVAIILLFLCIFGLRIKLCPQTQVDSKSCVSYIQKRNIRVEVSPEQSRKNSIILFGLL